MADPDGLVIDAVRGALRSSRRILLAVVGASLAVAYLGLTSYLDRAAEQAAVERDLRQVGAIINYAEEALKDVNAHALTRRNGTARDCSAFIGIAADAAAAQRLSAEARGALIRDVGDLNLAVTIGRRLDAAAQVYALRPDLISDVRPVVVLPATDCGSLLLWDIAVLARATWLRPDELRAALERFLSSELKDRGAAEALRDDLLEIEARRGQTGAERALKNADLLVDALEQRARASGRFAAGGRHATLDEARAAAAELATRSRRIADQLAGEIPVELTPLPVKLTLADLLWVGPLFLAFAFAASNQALARALELSRSLTDPRLRTAALMDSEELVPSTSPSHRFLMPHLTTALLLAVPFVVALLLWVTYWRAVSALAHVAYGVGLALALVAATIRWRMSRPLDTSECSRATTMPSGKLASLLCQLKQLLLFRACRRGKPRVHGISRKG